MPPFRGRYVVRSSKETSLVEAIAAANEFEQDLFRKANSAVANDKTSSFEHYAEQMLALEKSRRVSHDSDRKLLYRQKDGIIRYFGDHDVTKITTRMIRDYLIALDKARDKPLAESTKAKHMIVIRKVLALAVEDGLMKTIPVLPKQKTKDTPRNAFTDEEYKRFMKTAEECARNGGKVRGVTIRGNHVRTFRFIVQSFLRPTQGELFGLRDRDIEKKGSPPHLELTVHGGKTGKRTSVTMPLAVKIYRGMLNPSDENGPDPTGYVWFPEYENRTTAINTARRIFIHIIEKVKLGDETREPTPYSLRHYALQSRLRRSNGKVNIYFLAKNAGTSVDQLERFYLKKMAPPKEMIENLHT